MTKLFAVIKREYLQRVRSRMFIVATLLGPLMVIVFSVVPAFMFSLKTGGATRIAVVDETGIMYDRVRNSILRDRDAEEEIQGNSGIEAAVNSNARDRVRKAGSAMSGSFAIESAPVVDGDPARAIALLAERVRRNELDGYIVLPKDLLVTLQASFFGRNVGDIITREQLQRGLSDAVRDERMAEAHISESQAREMSRPVSLSARPVTEGGEGAEDTGQAFYMVFIVGFLIYLTLIMYGQVILSAVVEEKETRIAEMLFSSMRSFPLMIGKLVGVSLVALTQYAIWGLAFLALAVYGAAALAERGMNIPLPKIPPSLVIYFFLYFLLGYFIYATIYALLGSMVTTTQEGGQLALPVIFMLMAAFYLAFPISRSPNSPFAVWVSMVPFFSPIVMLVRIVTQPPPLWQIMLSLSIGAASVVFLMWLAGRIYRIGMLMYGKRATIPEVMRWIRQT